MTNSPTPPRSVERFGHDPNTAKRGYPPNNKGGTTMGIYSALFILIPLVMAASIAEGIMALIDRVREAREWKRIRRAYYPKFHY